MKRIMNAIKQFKLRDLEAPFIFLLLLVPSLIFRLVNKIKGRKLWLVAEQGDARDNGYHFYKYVRKNHPKDFCFYAIKFNSAGYEKVAELGNVIKYGSLKHWLYYMAANLNISSQKSGNPAPIFWYIMHVKLGLYKDRVFLQHGIVKDDLKFVYYNCTKFKYFVCGAKREYDYVLKKFGYSKDSLILSGLPRWDNLKDTSKEQKNKSILIMPTWRDWLGGEKNNAFEIKDFTSTNFYKYWNTLLNDKSFIELLEKNDIVAYFYPHANMQKFLKSFKSKSKNIKMVSTKQSIQEFLNKCNLMITDYSSAVFDFAYLGKPIVYYQFDKTEYRKKQYAEGYFSYEEDGFGEVITENDSLVKVIKYYIQHNFTPKIKHVKRMSSFFTIRDTKNSERIYEVIK